MQAVILAGGLGTRLRPLTYKIPKPMVLVNGRPFLEYQLNLLKGYGIKNILLCIGYKWKLVEKYFGNGAKLGIKILYSIDEELLGTGGALKNASALLEDEFLLLNGDTFLPLDYKNLIKHFYEQDVLGILVIFKNKTGSSIGNVSIDKYGFITDYGRNSSCNRSNYIAAGVSIYKKKFFAFFPKKKSFSFESEVYPKLISRKQLRGYLCKNQFYDIGTFKGLRIFKGAK